MAEWKNGEEFVKAVSESKDEPQLLFNTIDQIVTAYAGSANCNPVAIPRLYASLYDLLKNGRLY